MGEIRTEEEIQAVSNESNNRGTVFHEGESDDAKGLEPDIKSVEINRLGEGNDEKNWEKWKNCEINQSANQIHENIFQIFKSIFIFYVLYFIVICYNFI